MNPARAGRIAVIMGGSSPEREISLKSGAAVLASLQSQGYAAQGLDSKQPVLPQLDSIGCERAFVVVHGAGGEDGSVQGALDWLRIPYTGSGLQASAVAFDKALCKLVWQDAGLPTPGFRLLHPAADIAAECERIQFPLPWAVKPARAGSSYGVSMVAGMDELPAAVSLARQYDERVLLEQWIEGEEYTVGIVQGKVLPAIKLETTRSFYDYVAKYQSQDTRYICPCGLAPGQERSLAEIARAAFSALGARGWGRVDFMLDKAGKPCLLELNTVPGMTEHSLLPKAAKQVGMSFDELVLAILDSSDEAERGVQHVA